MQTYSYIIFNSKFVEQTYILECTSYARFIYLNGIHSRSVLAIEQDSSACRLINLCQQIEYCSLTCSVRADKTCDLCLSYSQVEFIYRSKSAKIYTEMTCLKYRDLVYITFGHNAFTRNRYYFILITHSKHLPLQLPFPFCQQTFP